MFADSGGVKCFGSLVGASVFFAFDKIGELRWLLAVATTREAAMKRQATTIVGLSVAPGFRWQI